MTRANARTDAFLLEFLEGAYHEEPEHPNPAFMETQYLIGDLVMLSQDCGFTGYNLTAHFYRPGRLRSLVLSRFRAVPSDATPQRNIYCVPSLPLEAHFERMGAYAGKWKLLVLEHILTT